MNSSEHLILNANPLVVALQKPAAEFTKADIISYIVKNDIHMVNFMYPGGDGKLKTLNFVINDLAYLDTILTCGERVDGSSLFSFIQAGSSDLYVLPRFRTLPKFLLLPCSALISTKTVTRWSRRLSTRSIRLPRHLGRLRGLNSRLWVNWSIMSSVTTKGCSRLRTSVAITNRLPMRKLTSSVPVACSTSHRRVVRLSTVILRWATSALTARTTSRTR